MSNDLKVFREAAAGYKMIPVKSLPLVALQVIAADDEIERLEARVAELEADLRDIEIFSDRLEAPEFVKFIHRIAKQALGEKE